jgi:hypothetical protein
MEQRMKTWLVSAVSILGVVACAPIPEPETPPPPPAKPPQRQPLPPAPDMPVIVYASAAGLEARELPLAELSRSRLTPAPSED